MSYRDLRNFTEMMQTLGYPRLISFENFRNPNFPLVAEILVWLIKRYDPTSDIPTDVDTEQDRVIFIKSAAHLMATKAHIKLNTKKLYGADGYAVKELLKITSLLYKAMNTDKEESEDEHSLGTNIGNTELRNKTTDLKACRQLASEITSKGAILYELLGQEVGLREARKMAVSRSVDIDEIEQGVERCVSSLNNEIQRINHRMGNLGSDEQTLELKIEKKRQDLDRNKKRLQSLANVRPAFMDEYERLENDLQKQYEIYVEKFRNLMYLEQQVEEQKRIEENRHEEQEDNLRRVKIQMQEENQKSLHDSLLQDEVNEFDDMSGVKSHGIGGRVIGTMTGEGIASDDGSVSLSSGSEGQGDGLRDDDDLDLDNDDDAVDMQQGTSDDESNF